MTANTPLLLKYRIECHIMPEGNTGNFDIWCSENPVEIVSDYPNNDNWYTLPQLCVNLSCMTAYNDFIMPLGSYKRGWNKIWYRLDLIIGQQIIGKIWAPIVRINKTAEDGMMNINRVFIDIWKSNQMIRKSLQDFERQKTDFIRIHLPTSSPDINVFRSVKIDNKANLVPAISWN